jgi:hypothetical protein
MSRGRPEARRLWTPNGWPGLREKGNGPAGLPDEALAVVVG